MCGMPLRVRCPRARSSDYFTDSRRIFKEKFSALTITCNDKKDLDIPECLAELQACRDDIIAICQDFANKAFDRGDYRELVSLTLLYLNAEDQVDQRFNQPSALHRARWMAKLLYLMKMDMLGSKIE
eukprot:GHVU01156346.1.p1 GENE.GHVU01156346.1~~GHVU01156346.1.p1  ORF type:complete len:127 (-),score=11.73 GHVU01156346.1:832-1212(-)